MPKSSPRVPSTDAPPPPPAGGASGDTDSLDPMVTEGLANPSTSDSSPGAEASLDPTLDPTLDLVTVQPCAVCGASATLDTPCTRCDNPDPATIPGDAPTDPSVPPWRVAVRCRSTCTVYLGQAPVLVPGGTWLTGASDADHVRGDEHFEAIPVRSPAHMACLQRADAVLLAELHRAAAALGYEVHPHGLIVHTRGSGRVRR